MNVPRIFPLAIGLILFSFAIMSALIVPFIDLLYRLKITRRKEAPRKGKVPLFDKLHDKKAGTPVGGGILIILVTSLLFVLMFPFANHMGVYIESAFNLKYEILLIFFTFISFGLLGFTDDILKIYSKPVSGALGMLFGLRRKHKFMIQIILSGIISLILYYKLGISILHIPLIDKTLNLGILYIPFSMFVVVSFSNAFNITDGLDGLSVGLLLICLIAFGGIAAASLDTSLWLFIALWVGALISFLYFNVWPARVWLGDAGALSFGAMLALIGLMTGSIVALVVIGGIFVVEITSSAIQMLGWRYLKRPIFPLAPIHHSFLARGWEEPKIVMRAWLAGIVLALFGLWLATI